MLGVVILLGLAFVWWEGHVSQPFIDLHLLATNRPLILTYVRFALAMLCVYTVMYGVTQWLEIDKNISCADAGFIILPMSIISIVLAWLVRGGTSCALLLLCLPLPAWQGLRVYFYLPRRLR